MNRSPVWEKRWDKELEAMLPQDAPTYYIKRPAMCDQCPFYKDHWPMAACVKAKCRNITDQLPLPEKLVEPDDPENPDLLNVQYEFYLDKCGAAEKRPLTFGKWHERVKAKRA